MATTDCNAINLQRNSKVFFSSVDLAGTGTAADMTPANTYEVEVLAGFAMSASAATQDITSLESGLTPDRSQQRFNTSIEPVNWSFSAYVKPTGAENTATIGSEVTIPYATGVTRGSITNISSIEGNAQCQISNTRAARTTVTGNSMPVADWFLWQALVCNTTPATTTSSNAALQSSWNNNGTLRTNTRSGNNATYVLAATTTLAQAVELTEAYEANISVASSRTNIGRAQENHIYFKIDNKYYQVANATVNQATIDASIEDIAMTAWSGFGTQLVDLGEPGDTNYDKANTVFYDSTTADTTIYTTVSTATGTAGGDITYTSTNTEKYHPFNEMRVRKTTSTATNYEVAANASNDFIQSRLSEIELVHLPEGTADTPSNRESNKYTFPVTALSFDYNNNITYLTPEELSRLNEPIGQFTGARAVTGSLTMYLKGGDNESAAFLKAIYEDSRTKISDYASATLWIGGKEGSHIQLDMDNVQFEFPQISIEDVISMTVNFNAQQAPNTCDGGEVTITVHKEEV